MRIIAIVFLVILSTFCVAENQHYGAIYRIANNYSNPLKLRIDADTSHLGTFVVSLPKRSIAKAAPPVRTVFCADNNLPINYGDPVSCNLIYWFVEFIEEPAEGINGAGQTDVYLNNGQWLLTEGGNFPRIASVSNTLICINEQNCQPLPNNDELPLILIWGKRPTTLRLSNLTVHIFTDKIGDMLNKQKYSKQLDAGFNYIYSIFKKNVTVPLNIVWLARCFDSNAAGGLAGYNAFLVNYYVKDGVLAEGAEAKLIRTTLHEFVHISTGGKLATWIEEGLAEFYAYKAYCLDRYDGDALKAWEQSGLFHPYHSVGLYEAGQKIQQGDQSYYSLLYIKGAAFWEELDKLLQSHQQSMDQFIPYLLSSSQTTDRELPSVFVEKIIEIIGENAFNELETKYLK